MHRVAVIAILGNSDVFEDKLNLYPSESFQFLLSGNNS